MVSELQWTATPKAGRDAGDTSRVTGAHVKWHDTESATGAATSCGNKSRCSPQNEQNTQHPYATAAAPTTNTPFRDTTMAVSTVAHNTHKARRTGGRTPNAAAGGCPSTATAHPPVSTSNGPRRHIPHNKKNTSTHHKLPTRPRTPLERTTSTTPVKISPNLFSPISAYCAVNPPYIQGTFFMLNPSHFRRLGPAGVRLLPSVAAQPTLSAPFSGPLLR